MTDMVTAEGIGKRIQAIRKKRGFASARDLADAIIGGSVSESVIQNIEAGRKSDLTVSQLLNIAAALKTSPLFLLVPQGKQHAALDLPNLSEAVEKMTVGEFDNWVSAETFGPYRPGRDEWLDRKMLEAARELRNTRAEWTRLSLSRRSEAERRAELGESEAQLQARRDFDTTQERMNELERRMASASEFLHNSGWFVEGD